MIARAKKEYPLVQLQDTVVRRKLLSTSDAEALPDIIPSLEWSRHARRECRSWQPQTHFSSVIAANRSNGVILHGSHRLIDRG
jgi:hypothetical protein